MDTPTLWDAPAFQSHSVTSRQASDSMKGKTQSLRAQVLALLKTETLTDEQIALRLNLSGSTARPRRIELQKAGLVEPAGITKTASGRNATTWTATTTNIGIHA